MVTVDFQSSGVLTGAHNFANVSGDETLDGISWRPHFKALAMESGSVLDLDGDDMSVETATGAGTVTNGSLTVTQSLQVSPSVFEDGGIAVEGNLILGAGATISFANSDDFRKRSAGSFTLATASEGIEGFTPSARRTAIRKNVANFQCCQFQYPNSNWEMALVIGNIFTLYPLLPDGTRLPAESLPAPDKSGAVRFRLDTAKALAWELVREE